MRTWASLAIGVMLVGFALTGSPCARAQETSPSLMFPLGDNGSFRLEGLIRSFYRNDGRIAWSGVEETYGAEGVLKPLIEFKENRFTFRARGEFFLNQPNGALLSDPVRDLFRSNFTTDSFEIFQLALEAEAGDWLVRFGRIASPLGRLASPMFTNNLIDAPFLRTDIIGFAETGVFVRWRPGPWSIEAGLSNGEPNLDTNSSKALVARVAYERDHGWIGGWIKSHDGTGSEQQKRFNSFVGFDAGFHVGDFTFYSEGLLDEHGLYRDINVDGNPYALGVRSLYGRDVNRGFREPIYGGGFDVGAKFERRGILVDWNFGVYFPERIGIGSHDDRIYRQLVKVAWNVSRQTQFYLIGIRENSRAQTFLELNNNSYSAIVFGAQLGF